MKEFGYEKQDFSSPELLSYISPLKALGQVDFWVARRKFSRAMVNRARLMPLMDGELAVKVLQVEDLIGLKLQALANDPKNRYAVDAPDIQRLLKLHRDRLDIGRVREYFNLFEKEDLLDEWLGEVD